MEPESNSKLKKILIGAGVVGGAVGAVALAPVALAAAGFGAGGVIAGSVAAGVQSGIGSVAAGSVFASLQSAGVLGFAATTNAGIGVAGGVLGGGTAGVINKLKTLFSKSRAGTGNANAGGSTGYGNLSNTGNRSLDAVNGGTGNERVNASNTDAGIPSTDDGDSSTQEVGGTSTQGTQTEFEYSEHHNAVQVTEDEDDVDVGLEELDDDVGLNPNTRGTQT